MPLAVRLAFVFVLAAVVAFCAFGFLATFEPLPGATKWVWRVVYGAVAAACAAGMAVNLRKIRRPRG